MMKKYFVLLKRLLRYKKNNENIEEHIKQSDKSSYIFNVSSGGQVNIVDNGGTVNAAVNNNKASKKDKMKKNILLMSIVLIFLSFFLIMYVNKRVKYQNISSKVNQIKLSMDSNYINNLLGMPISVIKHADSNITECLYRLDGVVVRIFYRNECADAYFITLTEKNAFLNIKTDDLFYPNERYLGDFAYYETSEVPTYIFGYFQNGTGNILYSEFYAGYKLRTHALMYMQYGTDLGYTIIPGEIIYDDKVTEEYVPFSNLFWPVDGVEELAERVDLNMTVDRKVACPNTFGVMSYFDLSIINYVTNYNDYDYSLLNNL